MILKLHNGIAIEVGRYPFGGTKTPDYLDGKWRHALRMFAEDVTEWASCDYDSWPEDWRSLSKESRLPFERLDYTRSRVQGGYSCNRSYWMYEQEEPMWMWFELLEDESVAVGYFEDWCGSQSPAVPILMCILDPDDHRSHVGGLWRRLQFAALAADSLHPHLHGCWGARDL